MHFILLALVWLASLSAQATIPVLNSSTPADNATGVSQTTNLELKFSKALTAVSGKNINIYQSGGSLVEAVDVSSAQVSLSQGNKTATVDFNTTLSGGTGYYILIDAGAFTNNGDAYPGISSSTELNFTTLADTTAPTVSFSPVNGATAVAANSNITLTFDESIRHTNDSAITNTSVDALITLKETNASGSNIAFDATISGNVITINPTSNFGSEQVVYVAIDATIEDDADNAITASSVTFTVVDTIAPTVTTSPTNGATNVSGNAHIEFIFNESVRHISDKALANNGGQNFTDIESLVTLKEDNASGANIAFSAEVDEELDGTIKIEVFPSANLGSLQTVYASLDATQIEDTSDNAIANSVSTTFTTASITLPDYDTTYPRNLHKNIGIDANIVLDFNMVVYAPTNSAGGNNDRYIEIYNADTGVRVFYELSDSVYISGSGTSQITIDPPNDLEEYVNYYILIGANAFRDGDGNGNFYPGVSDTDSLTFKTAKDPNKYADVTALNETHVEHSMHQAERSINAITNRQNYIRRHGGRNISHQGINFKFNNQRLDQTLNQLSPLIQHFEQYNVNKKLSKAVDNALPDEWGLWTAGEIVIGETNADNGSLDRRQDSREISVGLDKSFDKYKLAGIAYRFNKTETRIGSTGTKMDSNTQSWSLYGSIKNGTNKELEASVGWSDISTDHTRVDGVNTYTGVRDSHQVFGCFIARENHNIDKLSLSPFVRLDTSYTKQYAYSETGDSDTAYDALHYKDNNFHDTVLSLGLDVSTEYQLSQKTLKPYLSFRHKENMGYESSNTMYYLSNPIKEYTQTITSNHDESGFNLITGVDIQSEEGWLINLSYELSESELTLNKGLRFRVDWKF